jgi:hypothetical protein
MAYYFGSLAGALVVVWAISRIIRRLSFHKSSKWTRVLGPNGVTLFIATGLGAIGFADGGSPQYWNALLLYAPAVMILVLADAWKGELLSPGPGRNWLLSSLAVFGLILVYGEQMPDAETSAALDQLDGLVAGMRSDLDETQRYVDSVAAESGVPPAPTTDQEEFTAVIRATAAVMERYLEIDAVLAEEYGVHVDPNAMWLENDYYVRPSSYPDLQRYFVGFRDYVAASREAVSDESARTVFVEAFQQVGLGGRPNLVEEAMQGYRATRPSQDSLYTVMDAYATTIIEFHDELRRFEGGFVVDPVSGELALSGAAPPDTLLALEESIPILAQEMLERQERAVMFMESGVDSLRELARR